MAAMAMLELMLHSHKAKKRALVLRILALSLFVFLLASLCICSSYSLSSMDYKKSSKTTSRFSRSRTSKEMWVDEWMKERKFTNSNSTFHFQLDESFKHDLTKHLLFPDTSTSSGSSSRSRSSIKEGSALYVPSSICSLKLRQGKDEKYFREMHNSFHLDARYGNPSEAHPPLQEERLIILKKLFKAWATFADERHIPYNIAHGALLGWTWGQKIMPWDDDLDVQVPSEYLNVLLSLSNQTYSENRYLLDVNPHFQETSEIKQNLIDGRFIDTETGYFIDITGLYMAENRDSTGYVLIRDKNWHKYRIIDFFPLVRTTFEGIQTWVPFNSQRYLQNEYGLQGTKASFTYNPKQHKFDKKTKSWVQVIR